ncbi:MAG: ABC transporter permease, partial [Bacilli bacterium]|nr:ABC transporter permease [Bacilli bacterium]
MKKFKRFAWPYFFWMFVFTVIPIFLLFAMSFIEMKSLNFSTARFSFSAFSKSFNPIYLNAFTNSIRLALIATVLCIIIGYPLAYIVSNLNITNRFSFLLILIMPMFTNMLLRVNTISKLLKPESILKNVLGISLNISGSEKAVVLVMVLMYLPFMVFPIFTVLEKIDPSLLEASRDLGANNFKTFLKVTLPLSVKGIS